MHGILKLTPVVNAEGFAVMELREVALRYGELLLKLIRIHGSVGRMGALDDLCDRFERLMDNLPPAPDPLVWDGDYA